MRVYNEYPNEKSFGELEVGTCFKFNEYTLMKIEEFVSDKRRCNAVDLETGGGRYFSEDDDVNVVNAVVKIMLM